MTTMRARQTHRRARTRARARSHARTHARTSVVTYVRSRIIRSVRSNDGARARRERESERERGSDRKRERVGQREPKRMEKERERGSREWEKKREAEHPRARWTEGRKKETGKEERYMYASLRAARHTELRADRRDRACLELTFLVSPTVLFPPVSPSSARFSPSLFLLSPPASRRLARSVLLLVHLLPPPRAFVTVLTALVTSQLALAPASPLSRLRSRPRERVLAASSCVLFIIIKRLLYWSRKRGTLT